MSRYQIIAVDLPGHGRSDGTALQSIEAYMQRVTSFLESISIHKAILVGHGMGGAIALMTAIRRPRLAAGLGLVASGAFLGGETDITEEFSAPFGLSRALQMIQGRAFGSLTNPDVIKGVMQALAKVRYGVLYSDWRACAGFDLRSEAHLLEIPVWAAVGEEDCLTPPAWSSVLVDHLPDAALQVISGAGHMVPYEAGAELALGLQAFLERIEFQRRTLGIHDTFTTSEYTGETRANRQNQASYI